MEIKIELPEWKCENIISINGFVSEEVTAYYKKHTNPYNDNDEYIYYPIKIRIAYPKYARPEELSKEYPMLDVLQDFKYEKVVKNLFNDHLWKIIVSQHKHG